MLDDGGGGGCLSWPYFWGDLDYTPLRGRLSEYNSALGEVTIVKDAIAESAAGFRELAGADEFWALKGDVAVQLTNVAQALDERYYELEPIFEDLESAFQHHVTELDALQTEANQALARANTRWSTRSARQSDLTTAQSVLTTLQNQLDALRSGDGTPEEIDAKQTAVTTQSGVVTGAQTDYDTADDAFQGSRTEYFNIQAAETTLLNTTAAALDDIGLGDLRDPGWLEKTLGSVADFFQGIAENLANAFQALINGEFMDFLHYLSDALGDILLVMAAIAVVVLVVLATIGTGGAFLAMLGTIMTVVGFVKLGVDSILAGTAAPHPVTGLPKTWGDVALDVAIMIAGAGVSRVVARSLSPSVRAMLRSRVPPRGYSSTRAGRTYRHNRRIIDAADNGRGMGSRRTGDRLTPRQVRERAVEARRYNREYDAAQTTHQNNINRADEIAIGATEAGVDGGVELATDAGKRVSARVRDAINSGKTYVRQVGEEGPSSLPDNGVFHIAGATR